MNGSKKYILPYRADVNPSHSVTQSLNHSLPFPARLPDRRVLCLCRIVPSVFDQ
jgi:hypothetical protein